MPLCVCNHLVDGALTQWCPIPSHRLDVECDWLCPDCLGRVADLAVSDLQAICCHCADHLRATASLRELVHRYCVLVEQEFAEGRDCSADTPAIEVQITNGLRGLRYPLEVCVSMEQCWNEYPFLEPELRAVVSERLSDLGCESGTIGTWIELNDRLDDCVDENEACQIDLTEPVRRETDAEKRDK